MQENSRNPIRWRFRRSASFIEPNYPGTLQCLLQRLGSEQHSRPIRSRYPSSVRGLYEDIDFQQGGKDLYLVWYRQHQRRTKRTLERRVRTNSQWACCNGRRIPQVLHCSIKTNRLSVHWVAVHLLAKNRTEPILMVNFIITGINIQTKTIHLVWIYI